MSTLKPFESPECPKCGLEVFHRVGDRHAIPLPIFAHGELAKTSDLNVYVKVCSNCGFLESYASFVIDDVSQGQRVVVTRAPNGGYILSINVSYRHRDQEATDFSIPLSSDQWLTLWLAEKTLDDEALLSRVFYGAYGRAWEERVPPAARPKNLAMDIRSAIREGVTLND